LAVRKAGFFPLLSSPKPLSLEGNKVMLTAVVLITLVAVVAAAAAAPAPSPVRVRSTPRRR